MKTNNYTRPAEIEDLKGETTRDILNSIPDGYTVHRSVGYSQGDLCFVIYDGEEDRDSNKIIDSILWDTPAYVYIKVGDEEYTTGELLNDEYAYSKSEIISRFDDPKVIEFLKTHLPECVG